ncbi:hypothetical protein Trydic_g8121 [Trypoxylus dichotomus]
MLKQIFRHTLDQHYAWCKRLKSCRILVDGDKRSREPSTTITPEDVVAVWNAVANYRRQTRQDICNIVELSYGTYQGILAEEMNMRRIAATFVTPIVFIK